MEPTLQQLQSLLLFRLDELHSSGVTRASTANSIQAISCRNCISYLLQCDLQAYFKQYPNWIKTFLSDFQFLTFPFFHVMSGIDDLPWALIVQFDGVVLDFLLFLQRFDFFRSTIQNQSKNINRSLSFLLTSGWWCQERGRRRRRER